MKSWKKKLLCPLMALAFALAASQPAFAQIPGDDDDDTIGPPTANVPDGGATVLLLTGACVGIEALRRKLKRP